MCYSVKSKGLKFFLVVMAIVVSSSLDELHAFQSTRCGTLRTRGDASTSLHGAGEVTVTCQCLFVSFLLILVSSCAIILLCEHEPGREARQAAQARY